MTGLQFPSVSFRCLPYPSRYSIQKTKDEEGYGTVKKDDEDERSGTRPMVSIHFPSASFSSLPYPAHHTFFTSLISLSSIIGAGPEIPPSLRTRQKCTTMKADAMIGMATQCQM